MEGMTEERSLGEKERKRFATVTFGCQMNLHDTERMAGVLLARGWEQTEDLLVADAILILTCCVRESAEDRFWGYLQSLRPLKKNREVIIAVGGCIAQREGSKILKKAPHVDVVFGTQQYVNIVSLLEQARRGSICSLEMEGVGLRGIPMQRKERFRAWVPIISGCENFCSYCVVPYTRGRETSRPAEEIREEVAALAEEGVKEVILLGQNVNAYGRDLYGKSEFASLLHELAESYPGLWIRFLTSHPRDFGDDIVEVVAEHHNICRYIHLPLQAGSDRILEAMNRGYSRSYYLERVESIRARIPGCAISTDIIVGFPGESEEDFAQTLEAVEQCKFDLAYTYIYNRREGTPAAVMEGEVPRQVKMERFNRLADLVKRLARESNAREVGRKMKILVEGRERKGKENWLRGRASNGKVVHFEGGEELIGTLVQVRITRAGNWSLTGEKIGGK